MSTIIIPGGGMGFNLIGTAVNLAILYFLFQFVKRNFKTFKSNRPLNIVRALKSMNVDISGMIPKRKRQPPPRVMPTFNSTYDQTKTYPGSSTDNYKNFCDTGAASGACNVPAFQAACRNQC